MDTQPGTMERSAAASASRARTMQLSVGWQRAFVVLWCVIALASILSLGLSIYSLNVWDRVPAADSQNYFPQMTAADIQAHAGWQSLVLQSGLSLPVYAWIFTTARLIGSLALLLVSVMLMRRYGRHRMAALMAILLPVLAAAGIWANPLFGWTVLIAPWMKLVTQVLGWLTWCGAIVIFTFPDGKFTPRWSAVLAVLLVPLTFIKAFEFDIFLNPDNWPGLFDLAPYVLVIGGTLVAVLVRRARAVDQRQALRWYTVGWSLLVADYFVNLLLNDVYYAVAGHGLFEGAAAVRYVLLNEPIWFALEPVLAIGLALSVFRDKLLELPASPG